MRSVDNCKNFREAQILAKLFYNYMDVFSKEDEDMGNTTLVEDSILLAPRVWPVRQAPHRLEPAKEAEAEQQIQGLELGVDSDMESCSGASQKEAWRLCDDYQRLNSLT
jgi:hypothetical protein